MSSGSSSSAKVRGVGSRRCSQDLKQLAPGGGLVLYISEGLYIVHD